MAKEVWHPSHDLDAPTAAQYRGVFVAGLVVSIRGYDLYCVGSIRGHCHVRYLLTPRQSPSSLRLRRYPVKTETRAAGAGHGTATTATSRTSSLSHAGYAGTRVGDFAPVAS
eukprot:2093290-Rhodomonas_salina.1